MTYSRGVTGRSLTALYLSLLALLAAALGVGLANGRGSGRDWLEGLSEARAGLYREAQAIKSTRFGFRLAQQENALEEAGGLTFRQPSRCVLQDYARGCNLPLLEASPGVFLALAALLLAGAAGAFPWRPGGRRGLWLALAAAGFGVGLFGLGVANGTFDDRAPWEDFLAARVGLYRAAVTLADPGLAGVPLERLAELERRGGALTLRQPDGCFPPQNPRALSRPCNRVLVELPLRSWVAVAGLVGWVGLGGASTAAWSRRRARRPRGP